MPKTKFVTNRSRLRGKRCSACRKQSVLLIIAADHFHLCRKHFFAFAKYLAKKRKAENRE